MKLICDCGNEVNLVEPDDGLERTESEEGIYVTEDDVSKFYFWERHDQIGIVCIKCNKAIWMFV